MFLKQQFFMHLNNFISSASVGTVQVWYMVSVCYSFVDCYEEEVWLEICFTAAMNVRCATC